MRDKSAQWVIPSWFWICLGVICLVLMTMFTVIRLVPRGVEVAALPPPQPAVSLPIGATEPQVPVSLLPSPSGPVPTATPSGNGNWRITLPNGPRTTTPVPANPAPTTAPRTTPPAGPVTGRYQVLTSYSDSFIGQVLLTNSSSQPQNWQATLVFPGNVGDLVTSWLESQPQPKVSRSGNAYTWSGSVPLPARSTGELRFNFKRTGSGDAPSSCLVGSAACR